MDEMTDQNQPVSHPLSLTYASRDPVGPGAARRSRHSSPARPGACSPRASRGAASCAPAWQPIEEISRTFREPPGPVRPGWMICSAQTRGIRGAI